LSSSFSPTGDEIAAADDAHKVIVATGLLATVWSHMAVVMGIVSSGVALIIASGTIRLLRMAQA
jgi:hypothetical protein